MFCRVVVGVEGFPEYVVGGQFPAYVREKRARVSF